MKSPAFIVLFFVAHLQKDALCAISDKGAESRQRAIERAGVTFTLPPQASNADGTITWSELLEMTLERPGQAKKTVQLKKRNSNSIGALLKFANVGDSFMSYSDGEGNQLVCRVKSNDQAVPKTSKCVGLVDMDGQECIIVGGAMLCPVVEEQEGPFTIDKVEEPDILGKRKKRAEGLEALVKQARRRIKRQATTTQYNVEICMTADETVYGMLVNYGLTEDAELDTVLYMTALINEMNNFYSTITSTEMSISVVLLDAHVALTANDATWTYTTTTTTNGVVNYQEAFPLFATASDNYFTYINKCDAVIGLTRKDLSPTNDPSSTVGVAYVGATCVENWNLGFSEIDLRASYVLAHELGHLLNLQHDRSYSPPCNDTAYIMHWSIGTPDSERKWYGFSPGCSIPALEDFVARAGSACLLENNFTPAQLEEDRCVGFTGDVFDTPEEMCKLHHGPASTLCYTAPAEICNEWIWCRVSQTECRPHLVNDGYLCEAGTEKRCFKGYCTSEFPAHCVTTTTTPSPTTTTQSPTTTTQSPTTTTQSPTTTTQSPTTTTQSPTTTTQSPTTTTQSPTTTTTASVTTTTTAPPSTCACCSTNRPCSCHTRKKNGCESPCPGC